MGNTRVERYLADIGAHLKALSPAQHEEEVRELREHLDALVRDRRAEGLGDEEAGAAALRQFGDAGRIGRRLRGAWARRRPPRLWPWVTVYLGLAVLIFGAYATANDKPTDFPYGLAEQLVLALLLPSGMLAIGLITYVRARNAGRRV